MRLKYLPFVCLLLVAGCAESTKDTGISRSRAIAIAEANCKQYPDRFSEVDRSEWNDAGHYWLVSLTDRDGDHGKAFKINRHGEIIDTRDINREDTDRHYDDDYYSHRHYGYGYYGWW